MNLKIFSELDFLPALHTFFEKLNVPINHVADEPTTVKEILETTYKDNDTFRLTNEVYFVGMVDDASFKNKESATELNKIKSDYDGILIFGVTLRDRPNGLLPTRSQLAEISRAFNREFYYTPVVIVFKYNNHIAFANTERLKYKQEWREGEKAGKVTLLRDINIDKPHEGHHRILAELKIPNSGKNVVDSFAKLYTYWQEVLSVNILNKKFYNELSNWYFWAIQNVQFPGAPTFEEAHSKGKELDDLKQQHKATNVIRMLTRLLFVWFLKEKKLIPNELFELKALQQDILNEIAPTKQNGLFKEQNIDSVYYKAILQNLFFATLNCPIEGDSIDKRKRGFRSPKSNYGTMFLMRYEKYFKDKDSFLEMVNETVPFLNGGLFECLDERGIGEQKDERIWIDGFSDNLPKDQQLVVPDYLFFGLEEQTDLSDVVGISTREYKQAAVKGLINILESYKFTITENTPIEEDVALDPELLGKVFENLLASYNPETKTTARKQTGSFYTPREIVNYMVDESLIAYLTTVLGASSFEKDNPKQDASGTSIPNQDGSGTIFLDPNSEIEIKQGLLPHWKQDNVYYFVTFRLADSIPSDKQEELKADREKWNRRTKDKKDYTKEDWKDYNRLFNNRVEDWLNAGYGSCLLGKPENASIVANALKHFDNQRYFLDEWVVMPNHVHVLVKPLGENKITDILHSWKSYTANEINKQEGRIGQLWMRESYDHIVRNEDSLNHIRYYIQQNPAKAGISVLEASSFEKRNPKQDASGTLEDASGTLQDELRQLVSFDPTNPFDNNKKLTKDIINALSTCTIIDPACGSGAFPMGILQKMVHILQKLDPNNKVWKEVQREKANAESEEAFDKLEDKNARAQRLIEINEAFDESTNDPDYARKLFLIENCIYGVDIQPIATQISKLRFFISLVVEQKVNPEKENFGIRPLPNLETKFVAANTLIGIDRPKKGDQLNMFSTERLKELETELKQVRSKLFSAKTKETKVKYRNRDEELRNAIAKELQQNGWESDTAQKLASWDPYDQNASSDFFDSEWMFDIKEGFDVVIGNPPYVSVRTKSFNRELLPYYKSNYLTAIGQFDLYNLFIERSERILNKFGVLSFIVPKRLLSNENFESIRKFLLSKLKISKYLDAEMPFEAAIVEANVILCTRENHEYVKIYSFQTNGIEYLKSINYTSIERFPFQIFPFTINQNDIKIIEVINSQTDKSFGDYLNITRGFECGFNHPAISNSGIDFIIRGENVKPYSIIQPSTKVTPDFSERKTFKTKEIFKTKPKLVTKFVSNTLDFALDEYGYYNTNTIYNINLQLSGQNIYSFLALGNSKLMNYWFFHTYVNDDNVFPHIQKNQLESIPIKSIALKSQISLFGEILSFNNNKDINNIKDAYIFNLYFPDHMKERDIDVLEFVEQDIENALQGREFEKLNGDEKNIVIEQLHTTWTNPNNEVVKRIGMFREKSPDLLGVILDS